MSPRVGRSQSPASNSTDSIHDETSDDGSQSSEGSPESLSGQGEPGEKLSESLISTISILQEEKRTLEKQIRVERDTREKVEGDLAEKEKSFTRSEEAWKNKIECLERDSEEMLTQKVSQPVKSSRAFLPIAAIGILTNTSISFLVCDFISSCGLCLCR